MHGGHCILSRSRAQQLVALSSAEAELNASVKGLSELIGLYNRASEILQMSPKLTLSTDASACRGKLHRHGAGKVKHLSVKQLWSQEAVRCFGVEVHRLPRAENPADILMHSAIFPVADQQLSRLNFRRLGRSEAQ